MSREALEEEKQAEQEAERQAREAAAQKKREARQRANEREEQARRDRAAKERQISAKAERASAPAKSALKDAATGEVRSVGEAWTGCEAVSSRRDREAHAAEGTSGQAAGPSSLVLTRRRARGQVPARRSSVRVRWSGDPRISGGSTMAEAVGSGRAGGTAPGRDRAARGALPEHDRHGAGRGDCRVDPVRRRLCRRGAAAVGADRDGGLPADRVVHRRAGQEPPGRGLARSLRVAGSAHQPGLPHLLGLPVHRRA